MGNATLYKGDCVAVLNAFPERSIEKQVASNLGLLGFTPSDRTRLGVAEVAKTTKLDEMLRRRRERDLPVEQVASAGSSILEEEKT